MALHSLSCWVNELQEEGSEQLLEIITKKVRTLNDQIDYLILMAAKSKINSPLNSN